MPARLTRELRALDPGIQCRGLGGPQFAAAGGTLVDDYRGLAVTGLTEAIAKMPRSLRGHPPARSKRGRAPPRRRARR